MKLLLLLVPIFAHAFDCKDNSVLQCEVTYRGEKGLARPLTLGVEQSKAIMEYRDSGEPSLDSCSAELGFNKFNLYIHAAYFADHELVITASQGDTHPTISAAIPANTPLEYLHEYSKPFLLPSGEKVTSAKIRCEVKL